MASRNPILNDSAFSGGGTAVLERPEDAAAAAAANFGTQPGFAPPPTATTAGRVMTLGGVASAAGLMITVVVAAGWWGWTQVTESRVIDTLGRASTDVTMSHPGILIGGIAVAFVSAIAATFKPGWARVLWLPYSIGEGLALGMISHLYDVQTKGVAVQAVLATFGVFLVMLVLYGLRILRATPKFTKGVIAATMGIALMYLVGFVASLFGADLRFWSSASPLGIAVSVVIVIVASLNLILDFDFIERGSRSGLPASMDWYAAFGLVLTLVWLYLELLRLLSKLQSR